MCICRKHIIDDRWTIVRNRMNTLQHSAKLFQVSEILSKLFVEIYILSQVNFHSSAFIAVQKLRPLDSLPSLSQITQLM